MAIAAVGERSPSDRLALTPVEHSASIGGEALPRLRTVSPGRARLGRGVLYDRRLFRRVVSSEEPQARFDDITNDERSASERYRVRRWLRPNVWAWDQWLPSLRDPKMSWWPRSRKPPPVRGAHRATSRRHLSTAGRATAPVRRRFHPEEKTASPSPSVRPGGRTPTTLTRRLLGIGVTHVTAAPGRTDLRKKKAPHRAGQDGHRSHRGN
jgi:hypothetical protein